MSRQQASGSGFSPSTNRPDERQLMNEILVYAVPVPDARHNHFRTSPAELCLLQLPRVFGPRVLLRVPAPPLVCTACCTFTFDTSRGRRGRFPSPCPIGLGQ